VLKWIFDYAQAQVNSRPGEVTNLQLYISKVPNRSRSEPFAPIIIGFKPYRPTILKPYHPTFPKVTYFYSESAPLFICRGVDEEGAGNMYVLEDSEQTATSRFLTLPSAPTSVSSETMAKVRRKLVAVGDSICGKVRNLRSSTASHESLRNNILVRRIAY
jgi:hypothetical protein